jgi:hypothetical protein
MNALPRMALSSSPTPAGLVDPARAASGSRSEIPPASPGSGSAARFGERDYPPLTNTGNDGPAQRSSREIARWR